MNFKLLFIFLILFCSSLVHGQEYSGAYLESKSYDYLSLLFDQKIRDTATATQIARAKISIFSISTYDTDYILIKKHTADNAISALRKEGYNVVVN